MARNKRRKLHKGKFMQYMAAFLLGNSYYSPTVKLRNLFSTLKELILSLLAYS